eukprot:764389-Hanusia_phi.AAC.4
MLSQLVVLCSRLQALVARQPHDPSDCLLSPLRRGPGLPGSGPSKNNFSASSHSPARGDGGRGDMYEEGGGGGGEDRKVRRGREEERRGEERRGEERKELEGEGRRSENMSGNESRLKETVKEISSLLAETNDSSSSQGEGPAVQRVQKEMLDKLRVLRTTLEEERAPLKKLKEERDQANVCEVDVFLNLIVRPQAVEGQRQLEEQNAKMAYRIKHLLRAIDPSFAASVEASSAPVDLSVRKGSCLAGAVWK